MNLIPESLGPDWFLATIPLGQARCDPCALEEIETCAIALIHLVSDTNGLTTTFLCPKHKHIFEKGEEKGWG